ncbi:uncharacterized protein TNCV_194151 [Trichonephila clavipes]|nr:uncharacterized protein TNCV_194151 [Trichonephila clavipes]
MVFLVAPDPVFHAWVPSRVHCSQQFLTAHSERSTCPATQRVDQPAVFVLKIRPLSNSLNFENCLLARLSGMFRLPKSSYNRRIFMAVGSLVVRDRKAWFDARCLFPQNTLRLHTEYVLVKSLGAKVLWDESRVQGTE